jgi:hypothetical protein
LRLQFPGITTAYRWSAAVAQPVEHRIRNAGVGGSNPFRGTSFFLKNQARIGMYAGSWLLLSAAIALSSPPVRAAEPASGTPACVDSATIVFKRKADLPKGLLKVIGDAGPMADVDEPFNGTDVVQDPSLPSCQFVSARQSGCVLWVHYYWAWGRAAGVEIVRLRQIASAWAAEDGHFACPRR